MGDIMKCPSAKSIVTEHYKERDVAKVWEKIVEYFDSSTSAELMLQKLSTWLTSERMSTTGGGQETQLVNWKNVLIQYNNISPKPYTDYQGVQFLNTFVSDMLNLATILDTHRDAQAAVTNVVPLKTNYFIALLLRSTQQYDGSRLPPKRQRSKREINMNDFSLQELSLIHI